MTISCTRRLTFCAGHRVFGHESKCSNMHGHNYVVEVTAYPLSSLDELGRVIDFSVLKGALGSWLEESWDHGFIYSDQDKQIEEALALVTAHGNTPMKIFKAPFNPTAENMAKYLLNVVCPRLFSRYLGIDVRHVRIYETENCYADAHADWTHGAKA